jgi:hypothetical protein
MLEYKSQHIKCSYNYQMNCTLTRDFTHTMAKLLQTLVEKGIQRPLFLTCYNENHFQKVTR